MESWSVPWSAAILANTMLPDISREFLTRMMEGYAIERVNVGVADGSFTYEFSRQPAEGVTT